MKKKRLSPAWCTAVFTLIRWIIYEIKHPYIENNIYLCDC